MVVEIVDGRKTPMSSGRGTSESSVGANCRVRPRSGRNATRGGCEMCWRRERSRPEPPSLGSLPLSADEKASTQMNGVLVYDAGEVPNSGAVFIRAPPLRRNPNHSTNFLRRSLEPRIGFEEIIPPIYSTFCGNATTLVTTKTQSCQIPSTSARDPDLIFELAISDPIYLEVRGRWHFLTWVQLIADPRSFDSSHPRFGREFTLDFEPWPPSLALPNRDSLRIGRSA
jgi:hypothetical protein